MSLTAKEWLLLTKSEQERRKGELSSHECFFLRTTYSYIHFSEEEKEKMTKEEKNKFLQERTGEEKKKLSKQHLEVFEKMIKDANR